MLLRRFHDGCVCIHVALGAEQVLMFCSAAKSLSRSVSVPLNPLEVGLVLQSAGRLVERLD